MQPDGAQKVYLHAITHLARDTMRVRIPSGWRDDARALYGGRACRSHSAEWRSTLLLPLQPARGDASLCCRREEGVAEPRRVRSICMTMLRVGTEIEIAAAAQQLPAGRDRAAFGADRWRNRHHADLGHDPAPERDRRVVGASLRVADARRAPLSLKISNASTPIRRG